MSNLKYEYARTLAIVRELASGKRLTIGDTVIGMDEDMSIGPVIVGSDGEEHVAGLATMDLALLNKVLSKHRVGGVIPYE